MGYHGDGTFLLWYTFCIMISIVSSTGTLVNKLSTSKDASSSGFFTVFIIRINSFVESIMYCLGKYGAIMLLIHLAMTYVTVPTCDIMGRCGGSIWCLWIFGLPYIYPGSLCSDIFVIL